ncbi:hypothetical protein [Bordetella petrii]|uniref:hypothetical protein n=1 Tax=Bordetella petrii TaxID=94624 RepID=UPI001A971C93|nr:hypothetical protein [Bordetella petrii]MBO1112202.1 hypothetical protein [Bordetella petrii]
MLDPYKVCSDDVLLALTTIRNKDAARTLLLQAGQRYRVGGIASKDGTPPTARIFDETGQRVADLRLGVVAENLLNVTAEGEDAARAAWQSRTAIAYVDESGPSKAGYVRNLTEDRDEQFGVLCAVVVPTELKDQVESAFRPAFERFVAGAPEGEKWHITDAFKPGYEAWGEAAKSAREEAWRIVAQFNLCVVYDARRAALSRSRHELQQSFLKPLAAARRSDVDIPELRRLSDETMEGHLSEGLLLKLDCWAIDHHRERVDLAFDEMDQKLERTVNEVKKGLEELAHSSDVVKGFNKATREHVKGKIEISANAPHSNLPLSIERIGSISVLGKAQPLVLLADFVANALAHHLGNLSENAMLNAPASIAGWVLEKHVYGVRDDALEDLF